MARQFRKSVVLSPIGDPAIPIADGDFRYSGPVGLPVSTLFAQAKTSWIRLWADWYDIRRFGRTQIDTARVYALDQNIARARAALVSTRRGRGQFGGVVLTTRGYPLWANGTAHLVEDPADAGSLLKNPDDPCVQALRLDNPAVDNPDAEHPDRIPVNELRYRFPIPRAADVDANVCRPVGGVSYDFEPGVGIGSDWYYWIKFLAARYNPTPANRILPGDDPYANIRDPVTGLPLEPAPAGAVIDYLEFVNEPNLTPAEGWPQLDAAGAMVSPRVVARMFMTARQIRNVDLAGVAGPLMVGPASVDVLDARPVATRSVISCDKFTDEVLMQLKQMGYRPTRNVAWSHHNYDDVTFRRKLAPIAGNRAARRKPRTRPGKRRSTNSAALVRSYLLYHAWRGWPDRDPGNPRLLLTEGGVRRDKLTARFGWTGAKLNREHAARLTEGYELMRSAQGIGRGIAMFTQFHFYDQFASSFDSALVDSVEEGGAKRQPPFTAWGRLSRYKNPGPPP